MEEIYDYIASVLHSPENARRQYNRIADAIFTLEEMPELFKIMDFDFSRQKGLRRMLVDNYSVIYAVSGGQENPDTLPEGPLPAGRGW